jgi:RNA polymerase sigma factor (sigma-70 family)
MLGKWKVAWRHLRNLTGEQAGPSDRLLVERFVANRDEAAFELLVWRHGPLVLGTCRRLLRHEQDAEDAFQATFLTLARKAESIRQRETVGPWLHRVAHRIALRIREKGQREVPVEGCEPSVAITHEEGREGDLASVLSEEIHRLPEKYQEAIVLCYLQGKTHEEASRLLGCPKGTVSVRLMRARQRLRDRLNQRGFVSGVLATELDRATSVPESLLRGAVQAGVSKRSSTEIMSLAEEVIRMMQMSKLKLVGGVVVALILLGSAGFLFKPLLAGGGGEPPPSPRTQGRGSELHLLNVPAARAGILVVLGTEVKDEEKILKEQLVSWRQDGKVRTYRRLYEGDRVKEGQILGQLDNRLARLEWSRCKLRVEAAEADVRAASKTQEEARTRFQRVKALREKANVVTEEEVRAARLTWERFVEEEKARKAFLAQEQAAAEQARIIVDMHVVHSPVDGVIHRLCKRRGEGVQELETVVVLRLEEAKRRGDARPMREQADLPAERAGRLLVLGQKLAGERIPESETVEVEIGGLAVKLKPGEKIPESEQLHFSGEEQPYRRWKAGDALATGEMRVFTEKQRFRKLRVGNKVTEGEVLGLVDPSLAVVELRKAVVGLEAIEAHRRSAEKTRDEAQHRYDALKESKRRIPGSVSAEELRTARLTWDRFVEEAKARAAEVERGRVEVELALQILRQHEIRSPLTGQVLRIHKQRGEGVHLLEPVVRVGGR